MRRSTVVFALLLVAAALLPAAVAYACECGDGYRYSSSSQTSSSSTTCPVAGCTGNTAYSTYFHYYTITWNDGAEPVGFSITSACVHDSLDCGVRSSARAGRTTTLTASAGSLSITAARQLSTALRANRQAASAR